MEDLGIDLSLYSRARLTISQAIATSELGHGEPQELEVRSLNHPYSLKTKSPRCHYVVMTRSETKFQAPLNRRYQEVLAKTEHLTIKNYVNRSCEARITFSDISLSQNNERLKIRKK